MQNDVLTYFVVIMVSAIIQKDVGAMILVGVMVGNINVNYYSFLSHFTLSNKKEFDINEKYPTNNDASL